MTTFELFLPNTTNDSEIIHAADILVMPLNIRNAQMSLQCGCKKGYDSDKVEFLVVLTRYSTKPEHTGFLVVSKHTCSTQCVPVLTTQR